MPDQSKSQTLKGEQLKELLAKAQTSYSSGRYSESEDGYREVLRMSQDKANPDPQIEIAARIGLAEIYRERANYELAVGALNIAVDSLKQTSGGRESRSLVEALNDLGLAQLGLNDLEASEKTLNESLEIAKQLKPEDELAIASALNNLGRLYEQLEKFEEAEPLLTRALGTRRRLLPSNDLQIADSLTALAGLHAARTKLNLAELLLKEASMIREKTLGKTHPQTARTNQSLTSLRRRMGKLLEAERAWPDVITALEKSLPKEHPVTIVAINEYANTELSLGKIKEASSLFAKAATLVDRNKALDEQIALATFVGLGLSRMRERQFKEAEEYIRRALEKVGSAKKGTIHMEKSLLENLMGSLLMQGKIADMLKLVPDVVRARQTQQVDQYSEILQAIYQSLKKKS
jgi:tetratricopeptide (TPR) repeat protein